MIKSLITVYHPGCCVKENIRNIALQTDEVYICDNSPQKSEELCDFNIDNKINYIWFGENLGLSKAFNKVLLEQSFNDDDYIIFFDQDSSISEGHIQKLISEFEALEEQGEQIGCIAPVFFNTSNNTVESPRAKTPLNEHSFKVASVITSSMLCKYKDIKAINFWNERVFLDMADWDISWRLQESGKICVMTDAVTLKHSLGEGEKKVGPLKIRVGSAFREYYQTRECLYLLTKKYTPLKFKIRFLAMLSVRPVIHLLFLNNRKARLKYIIKGIKDFFCKKTGELKL
ncbi:MAG: glycosyltransferase [Clostridia bacterium]|nr:glycosyltransferase [Clostridia bacterium]